MNFYSKNSLEELDLAIATLESLSSEIFSLEASDEVFFSEEYSGFVIAPEDEYNQTLDFRKNPVWSEPVIIGLDKTTSSQISFNQQIPLKNHPKFVPKYQEQTNFTTSLEKNLKPSFIPLKTRKTSSVFEKENNNLSWLTLETMENHIPLSTCKKNCNHTDDTISIDIDYNLACVRGDTQKKRVTSSSAKSDDNLKWLKLISGNSLELPQTSNCKRKTYKPELTVKQRQNSLSRYRESIISNATLYSDEESSATKRLTLNLLHKTSCNTATFPRPTSYFQESINYNSNASSKSLSIKSPIPSLIFPMQNEDKPSTSTIEKQKNLQHPCREITSKISDRDSNPKNLYLFSAATCSTSIDKGSELVTVSGCTLSFYEHSFSRKLDVKLSCFYHLDAGAEKDKLILTPEICCHFDNESLQRPFLTRIPTCYGTICEEEPANVIIERCSQSKSWANFLRIQLKEDSFIEFKAKKAGSYRCFVTKEDYSKLSKRLRTVIYLKQDGKPDMCTVVCFVFDDWPHLTARVFFEMEPFTYERLNEWKYFTIKYDSSFQVRITTSNEDTEPFQYALSSDKVWDQVLFKKFEYKFKKSKTSKSNLAFVIQDNNENVLSTFFLNFDWCKKTTNPLRSDIHLSSTEDVSIKRTKQMHENCAEGSSNCGANQLSGTNFSKKEKISLKRKKSRSFRKNFEKAFTSFRKKY